MTRIIGSLKRRLRRIDLNAIVVPPPKMPQRLEDPKLTQEKKEIMTTPASSFNFTDDESLDYKGKKKR